MNFFPIIQKAGGPFLFDYGVAMPLASHNAVLARIFRADPPHQPGRFYRRTRDGQWLRGSSDLKFLGIKGDKLIGRISLFGSGSR